ncbi:MAG: hypothetical protein WEB00_15095 [Dehalococcoidia bacterium]
MFGRMRIMGRSGDTKVDWDLASEDAVREAERIFREHTARGAYAFRVGERADSVRIEEFDPAAREIVVLYPMSGG